jgi:hypothetical protein
MPEDRSRFIRSGERGSPEWYRTHFAHCNTHKETWALNPGQEKRRPDCPVGDADCKTAMGYKREWDRG